MTALLVILCIFLFLFLLLLCPIHLFARFENELCVKVRWLFIHYSVFPRPPEEGKPADAEGKKEITEKNETKSKIRGIIEQKGLSGFLNILQEFASIAAGTAKKLFARMVIDLISADITVSDEDAAQTAILYGGVCAAVCASVGVLLNSMKYKRYQINVVPDFQAKESKIQFDFKSHILPVLLVAPLLSALFRSLKILKSAAQVSKN